MKFIKSIAMVIFIFFSGCAVKNFPKIPFFSRIPKVKTVNYEIKHGELILSWIRVPKEKKVKSYNLYEAKAPEGIKYNFKSPKNYDLLKKILKDQLPEDMDKVTVTLKNLENKYKYCFGIKVENTKGKEGKLSNVACVDWLYLSNIIKDIKIQPDDHLLRIYWETNKIPEITFIGLNFYKKENGEMIEIASEVTENPYEIKGLKNKKLYTFYVAPVYSYYKTKLEGKLKKITGIPEDLTPPKLPEFITGIYTNNGILVKWSKSPSEDILGYDIERKMAGEKNYKRLNKSIIKDEKYFDSDVVKGKVYYYRIRCIDKNFNVSNFSKPIKVLAE